MELIEKLKSEAKTIRKELFALYFVFRDPRTGILPKIIIFIAIGYALSPIDLIPDFIPFIGYLDDIVIVPLLIILSIRLTPTNIMEEARNRAKKEVVNLKKNLFFGLIFVLIWLVLIFYLILFIYRLLF